MEMRYVSPVRGLTSAPRPHSTGTVYFRAHNLGGFGGAGRAGVDILCALSAVAANVTLVCDNPDTIPMCAPSGLQAMNIVVGPHSLRLPRVRGGSIRATLGYVKSLLFFVSSLPLAYRNVSRTKELQREVGVRPPAVVFHNGFPHPRDPSLGLMKRSSSALRFMIVHSSPQAELGFPSSIAGMTVRKISEAMHEWDGLIFVSPQVRDQWTSLMMAVPPLVRVIPPCCRDERIKSVLTESRAQVRQRLGHADDDFVIVTVGKVHPYKGQDQIVASMNEIIGHLPTAKLVVVGDRSQASSSLDEEVRKLGLADKVRFTGATEGALEHIYAADVLVHASRAEAFGLVIAEAMALGTPVIASDADGIPSLVLDGETGLLFAVDDRTGMVRRLLELVAEPRKTQARVALARQHYRANFSRPAMVAAYRGLLEELGVEVNAT